MSIVNTTLHHGTQPPCALFRRFRPTAELAGGIPTPTLACFMVVIGSETHGALR